MKRFLLLLTLLALGKAYAAPVPVQTAQTVALNFFKSKLDSTATAGVTAGLYYTKTEADGTVDFYVFNIAPSDGFVIVSGDDVAEPILAYSTESDFDVDVVPNIGLADWMETSAARINHIIRQGVIAGPLVSSQWALYKSAVPVQRYRATTVSPLLTTKWNQSPYYNQYCPLNSSSGQRCVTGCVATAMAQIMKYWNYPAKGVGSNSYTSGSYGVQSATFSTATYNWANMPNSLSANNTDLATLMYHCGVAVNMSYGTSSEGGSGAAVIGGKPSAQYAYANYFSYNGSAMKGVWQSNYTAAAWITLMQTELNAGRPIQYMGFMSGGGGHTWVCDGYDASNLFHMNWGWGGYDDGYYSLSNLNPNPYVFNTNDAALIGIQPSSVPSCAAPTGLSTASITVSSATFNWGAVSGSAGYNVQYRKVGTSTWTAATAATNTYAATGLVAATNYEWQVQNKCSASLTSAFTGSSTFTTLTGTVTCNTPAGLSTTNLGNTSVTLKWNSTGATNYNIQWKAASASTWTTISGASATSYVLNGLTACTAYQFQVQGNCTGTLSSYSSAASFTTTGCSSGYCTSRGLNTSYEYIKTVALGTINNTSGDNKGYADYTSLSTTLTGGSTVTISLTPGFYKSAYNEYFSVYIDYNHNGTFTDANEKVANVYGGTTVTKSFVIPATALNGNTRMRIQMQYGGYQANACANNFSYGEVEDYTVNIMGNAQVTLQAPEVAAEEVAATLELYPNPAQDNLTVKLSSATATDLTLNVYNLVGQRVMVNLLPVSEGVNTLNLNTATLAKGAYILETNNNGVTERRKFIIAR